MKPNNRAPGGAMKIKIAIVVSVIFLGLAALEGSQGEQKAYEIILIGEKVVFGSQETVTSQVILRDLGVKKVRLPNLLFGLSVVWDGKEYSHNPEHGPW